MKKLLLLALLPLTTFANPFVGADYYNINSDYLDGNLNDVVISGGYQLQLNDNVSIIPSLGIGSQLNKGTAGSSHISEDYFYMATLKGQYSFDSGLHAFVQYSKEWGNVDLDGFKLSDHTSIKGGGIGYNFDDVSFDISYLRGSGTRTIGLGVSYIF